MLLKALQDFGYGGSYGISKGKIYVGYAIKEGKRQKEVAVYNFSPEMSESNDVDPLFFPYSKFELIADNFSKTWITANIKEDAGFIYSSFPEFFDFDGFWYRLHDWSLDDEDYALIKKYKKQYEDVYKDANKVHR